MDTNYKVKIRKLINIQADILNQNGFYTEIGFDSRNELIMENTMYIKNSYDVCGGCFTLVVQLDNYYFGDTHIRPSVSIKSPYDNWWSKNWEIKEFITELDEFNNKLKHDIGLLVGLGIIESTNESDNDNNEDSE